MKAVVVDIKGRFAVVLDKKGSFISIPNNGRYVVGHEIDIMPRKAVVPAVYRKIASVAAVFAVVLGIGLGAFAYALPYSYVGIDINPSIELTANRFDRIIKARGLNEDGKRLLASKKLKYKKLAPALKDILEKAKESGYIDSEGDNAVMLAVTAKSQEKAAQLESVLEESASKELEQLADDTDLMVEKVPQEKRDQAVKQGVSPGRQLLIEKYREAKPEVKEEEASKTPVKDLMKAIKEYKKGVKRDGSQRLNEGDSSQKGDKGVKRDGSQWLNEGDGSQKGDKGVKRDGSQWLNEGDSSQKGAEGVKRDGSQWLNKGDWLNNGDNSPKKENGDGSPKYDGYNNANRYGFFNKIKSSISDTFSNWNKSSSSSKDKGNNGNNNNNNNNGQGKYKNNGKNNSPNNSGNKENKKNK